MFEGKVEHNLEQASYKAKGLYYNAQWKIHIKLEEENELPNF